MYCDGKGKLKFDPDDLVIGFYVDDIQKLSEKYFGDELTQKELESLYSTCTPDDWSRVDDGGWEGCLAHLIQAVLAIITLVRQDRRGGKS